LVVKQSDLHILRATFKGAFVVYFLDKTRLYVVYMMWSYCCSSEDVETYR